jgi:cytochrome P450
VLSDIDSAPLPAMPPRPARRLSTIGLLRAASTNSLAACDEELFEKLAVPRRYLGFPVFFISDPAGIKRVMLDNFDNYPRLASFRRLLENGLGTGSLASEGETWWRHRRLGGPTVNQHAFQPDVPILITMVERFAEQLAKTPPGLPFDLERQLDTLVMQLWNHVVTGGHPDAVPMLQCLKNFPRKPRLLDFLPLPGWLELLRPREAKKDEVAAFDGLLHALIAERLDPGYAGSRDLIWRLAHAQDRSTGERFPVVEIRDEAANLMAGGVSPTLRALTWIFYLLALHPRAEAKLHAELDRRLGAGPLLPEQLPELDYTRQVIEETLRLYPSIPAILREASAADVVCDLPVPRKSVMVILPWVVHRHRRLWDNPDRFDPERFTAENSAQRARLAYIPYATGPRVCTGMSFANTEMLLVVAALARRLRFRLDPGHPVMPVGRISLHPHGGLRVTVEPRSAVISQPASA